MREKGYLKLSEYICGREKSAVRFEADEKVVWTVLDDHGYLTVREIAECLCMRGILHERDTEYVENQLFTLACEGEVEKVGAAICRWTGQRVAVWKIREGERQYDLSRYARAVGNS